MAYLEHALIGLVAAVVVCLGLTQFPSQFAVEFLAAFLALTACVYFGSALSTGQAGTLVLETVVGLAVFAMALAGLWLSTGWVAAGYFVHGGWDVLHHPHRIGAKVIEWFPPVCLVFDWIVGAFILFRF